MNITFSSPTGFYSHFEPKTARGNLKNENNFKTAPLLSFEACCALKSAVLFKGNFENRTLDAQRKERLMEFQKKYNLKFNDINILSKAFCDKCYEDGTHVLHRDSYERLEFIGDRVLDLCVTDILAKNLPDAQEGELTQEKLRIVCNKNISRFGKKLEFEKLTSHGKHLDDKKYADMFEALLGAIYVDSGGIEGEGVQKAYNFLIENFEDEISVKPAEDGVDYFEEISSYFEDELKKDPSKLNCRASLKGRAFRSKVAYDGQIISKGKGANAAEAKQNALKAAFLKIKSPDFALD